MGIGIGAWLLIMTTCANTNSDRCFEPRITVAYLNDEQSCRKAGAIQEMIMRNDLHSKTNKQYTFVCVETSKGK